MKIGFCYDTQEDYGYAADSLEYTDFVSLDTIGEIIHALNMAGHEVIQIGNLDKLLIFLGSGTNDIDLFFNIAEGFGSRNREVLVPAVLEAYQCKYTASDAYAMAITLQKHQTKLLVNSIGVPTPKGFLFSELSSNVLDHAKRIGFPLVLKPNAEGGSMGLYLVESHQDLIAKFNEASKTIHGDWLIEEYIAGDEVTVPIIGYGNKTKALGVVTTTHEGGAPINLYDKKLKYVDDVINTDSFRYGEEIESSILECSEAIHKYFQLNDYSRMDFRIDEYGKYYFLEANLMPSLCRGGSFEVCGKSRGLDYYQVINTIVISALERQED